MHCPTCHAKLHHNAEVCDACGQEFCPECHAAIPARATLCLSCGAGWTLTCPDCGQVVLPMDTHCPACGLSFEGGSAKSKFKNGRIEGRFSIVSDKGFKTERTFLLLGPYE